MTEKMKIWLLIAISLVVIGSMMFAAVMMVYHWDFTKISTDKYETNTYEIGEEFNAILMNTDTANIHFAASDDEMCKVVCNEQKNIKYSVKVQEGTLIIDVVDERRWYEHIGINFNASQIKVYLPATEYTSLCINEGTGNIEIPNDFTFGGIDISLSTGTVRSFASVSDLMKIKASTGDIRVENIFAGVIDLSVSTGSVTVSDVNCEGDVKINVSTGKTYIIDTKCKNVISGGSTGDFSMKNVIAEEKVAVERSTGDVNFDDSDAAEIFVKTATGDVKGSLLTDKVYITQTDTGSVDVPKTVIGGRCEIITDTGDIKITVD